MAKRFTDTEKWSDIWYRELSLEMKLAWIYVLDKCDAAGFWKPDFGLISYSIGKKIKEDEFYRVFADRITIYANGRVQINKFISFQYGDLTESNKMYNKVQNLIKENGASMPHRSPIDGGKDKDKDILIPKESDLTKIVNIWNENVSLLPRVESLGPKRKSLMVARLRECSDLEKWKNNYESQLKNRFKPQTINPSEFSSKNAQLIARLKTKPAASKQEFNTKATYG
jgi:hypothetical protein